MAKFYQIACCIALLISLQSCYVRQRTNLSFLDPAVTGESAEIVSIKMPMFLVKPFLHKKLASEEDELARVAMKKIKSVKITALSNAKDSPGVQANFKNFLSTSGMDEFASIYSDGDQISINGLMKKDKIKKLLLGVSSNAGDHVFIEVKGNFSMHDIANAIHKYEERNP